MSVILQSSGGGQITLQEPTTASNFTQTLPAVNGTILTTGNIPAGSVLQVVQGTTSTYASTAGITYVDTTLTATITPSSASSKILAIVSQNGVYKEANAQSGINLRLLRGATVIQAIAIATFYDATTAQQRGSISSSFLDSPATTSATTYKTQFSNDGAGSGLVAVQNNAGNTTSSIILMEIAA